MQIRLHATKKEIDQFVDDMKHFYEIEDVSEFKKDRGATDLGRAYLTVKMSYLDTDGKVKEI